MGSELKTYLKTTRSCMDTPMNMHEGAHQEINRSLLPCRHTDNDIAIHKCIGIMGMHPCFYYLYIEPCLTVCGHKLKLGLLAM